MFEAQVSKQSQSHKLKERLQGAGMTHGESARVHLSGVEIKKNKEGPRVYFCRVGPVQVVEQMEEGDGKALPEEAELDGLAFPDEGLHRLENVIVRTNGRMRVEADEQTTVRTEGVFTRLGRFLQRLTGSSRETPTWQPW